MTEQMKKCSKCGEIKPATSEYFGKNRSRADGLQGYCIPCRRVYDKKWREKPDQKTKRQIYNRSQRYKDLTKKYRQTDKYKQWRKEYNQREDVIERRREYDKLRSKNPIRKAKSRERNLKYSRKPEVKRRQKIRRSTFKYREWMRKYNRKRRKTEKYKLQNKLSAQRRIARKRELPDTFTTDQWQRCLGYFDRKCAVCGTPQDMFIKLELDHWIPISSDDCTGTIATNIVPLCGGSEFASHIGCNQSKQDKNAIEWLTNRFGEKEAKRINQHIQDYFDWVREQDKD